MLKAFALTGLAAVLSGCASHAPAWKGKVEWPNEDSARLVGQPMEAGAALAAAGAVHEMVRTNPYPDLFHGCASPEQALDVVVFTGPTPGLYYVVLHQRFNRCGGPAVRVLDGWYSYAVTPQGEVVAEAPPPAGEDTPEAAPSDTAPRPSEPAAETTSQVPSPPAEPPPSPPQPTKTPPTPATPSSQPDPTPGP